MPVPHDAFVDVLLGKRSCGRGCSSVRQKLPGVCWAICWHWDQKHHFTWGMQGWTARAQLVRKQGKDIAFSTTNEHPKTNVHQLYIFSHLVSQADSVVELLYTTKGPRNTPVTQRNFISRVPRQRVDQTACTRTQKKYMAKQKNRICDFKCPKCISAHWPAHWNCAETLKFARLTNWAEEQAQRTCLAFCSSCGRTREKWDTIRVKGTAADYPSSPQGYNLTIRIYRTNFSRSAIF